jgi:hypothetical protein
MFFYNISLYSLKIHLFFPQKNKKKIFSLIEFEIKKKKERNEIRNNNIKKN